MSSLYIRQDTETIYILKSQRIEKDKHQTKLSQHVWNQKRKIENFRSDGPSSSKYQPAKTENETALYA